MTEDWTKDRQILSVERASRQRSPASRSAAEWQPIETAPTPNAYIWLSDGFSMRIGFWADGVEYEHHGSKGGGWRDMARLEARGPGDLLFAPTYWMPLPEIPGRMG